MINATSIADLGAWLREAAWPLWLTHGVAADGVGGLRGFVEQLDPATLTCRANFRRLRVAARQTYVFSQGFHDGLAGAEDAVALGIGFFAQHAAQPDGGYAWRFDLNNRAIDTTRDLYDHAFVLLALTSAAGVFPREMMHDEARHLLRYLQKTFVHPAGGYGESVPPSSPRRQNPHMHVLESLLAACETFGDTAFLDAARPLVDLFADRFFVSDAGVIGEYFFDDLSPMRDEQGMLNFEPGHHCEWVWLLDWYQRYAGPDARLAAISAQLMAAVDRCATPFGLPDAARHDGKITTPTYRLWPQTERLKAELLRADTSDTLVANAVAQLASWLHPNGLWDERRDARGTPMAGDVPASSLYHLTCAILTAEQIVA